jgi:hypothetical protein
MATQIRKLSSLALLNTPSVSFYLSLDSAILHYQAKNKKKRREYPSSKGLREGTVGLKHLSVINICTQIYGNYTTNHDKRITQHNKIFKEIYPACPSFTHK